ncbi:MAG: amidase family protein, partial [Leptolyngbyaceae cyanobacterium bins.59]|nr:amidase family protein [Leptolyngbyaceae cyanobacterium bins.59]
LNSVLTLNPDALATAKALDLERQVSGPRSLLHGIPILLKDNVDTVGLPTTAGSVALAGSIPPDDATIAKQLREAGAIILGKTNLTEFANFLTNGMPAGYSSLGGYVFNPYNPAALPGGDGRPVLSPGGSSAGSGASIAANLAVLAIGTETSGSILSPANQNSLVGIKPTVGLTSRDGIIPIAATQDVPGPMARTVADAAIMLGALTGIDLKDPATQASDGKFFTDYTPFLKLDGLSGKRIGVPRGTYTANLPADQLAIFNKSIDVMRSLGATVVDVDLLSSLPGSIILSYEFKRDLNAYLASLGPDAPVKTLQDVINFNNANASVALKYGQTQAISSQNRDLNPGSADTTRYLQDLANSELFARQQGIDKTINDNQLDALFFVGTRGAGIAARAGYPSIIVPAGYLNNGAPLGMTFTGKAFSEASLIELAYAYEQATLARRAPTSVPMLPGEVKVVPEPNITFGLSGVALALAMAGRRKRQVQGVGVKTTC